MIEIMFGESEAGSMKMAKRCKNDNDEEVICLGFLISGSLSTVFTAKN